VQKLTESPKIGVLGGTFDPVHNGHLAVAGHVLQALALDSVWFIPASKPPHKPGHQEGRKISSLKHRVTMLQKALNPYPDFVISDIEAKRATPSYSIDTINILVRQMGPEADLYFVIGADAFLEIDTWKRFRELPVLVNLVIISRPGSPFDKVEAVIRHSYTGYRYDPRQKTWNSPDNKGSFILQPMVPVPISSTQIREKVGRGEDIAGLVPSAVADYIKQHKLYKQEKFS
jgi:nicotinate-nucleotide adenylyltransferase